MATAAAEEKAGFPTAVGASWGTPLPAATLADIRALLEKAQSVFVADVPQSLLLSRQAAALIEAITPPPSANDPSASPRILLLARCQSSLARCLERQSHFEAAISEADKALALLEPLRREDQPITSEFITAYSDALHLLGNAQQRLGRHFEALNHYQTELRFLETMGASKEQVAVRNAIAAVSYHIGDHVTAMESALKALALAEETDHHHGKGSALNLLGNLYFKRGDNAAAMDSYQRSLAVFTDLDDRYWQAGVLGNYANVCLKTGDHDRAREMQQVSLRLREDVQDRQGQAHSLLNLGSLYAGKYESRAEITIRPEDIKPALALRYYKRALRLFRQVADKQGIASCLVRIGTLYALVERLPRALSYGDAALALAGEVGSREHVYEAHYLLSDVHERLGDFARSLTHHKQFHTIKEAVFNAENEERVRNLEILHRVAQATQDTDAQKRLSDRLAVTNKALRAADSEKALLLIKLRQQAGLLEMQVRTDALTGLTNRRTLDQCLEEEWEHARREKSSLCLVVCDVDRFKQINDRFSHQTGDTVLRRISSIFQRLLRKTDIVARYGGEEFVFLLRNTNLHEARRICEAIRVSVNADDWESVLPDLHVSISIGVCEATGALLDGAAENALRRADAALYEAKRQGRNRVCLAGM